MDNSDPASPLRQVEGDNNMTRFFLTFLAMMGPVVGGCDDGNGDDDGAVRVENDATLCSDKKDNDDDGAVDCDDAECSSFCVDADTEDEVSTDPDERHLLLRDEGNSVLHYIDLANEENSWHVDIPSGRDMQLVGGGRVLIGTERGYQEHDIATGDVVDELTTFSGTIAARRLRNGNTLLVGTNWRGETGIVLVEVDADGEVVHTISYAEYDYARLVRETVDDTFLVTSNTQIVELDRDGNLVWEATVDGSSEPHAWMAVRLGNGETVVSCGYAANLQFFDAEGEFVRKITAGTMDARPFFFAGFQILDTGNIVLTNWQDHGAGHGDSGLQVLEYEADDGDLVWYWEQDPSYISSLQAVIVLDGLDLDKLHVEDENGILAPVD